MNAANESHTRAEHIQWCKDRALEYLDQNDLGGAVSSMMSDLTKHQETDGHIGMQIGLVMMMGPVDAHKVRRWIEGFN